MNRTQLMLGGLLLLQLALIAVLRSPFTSAHAPSAPHPLLPELDTSVASRLELSGADGKVTVTRDGDAWKLDDLGGFPADPVKVADLLQTLAGLEVREPVVTSSRHHDNLQIADGDNAGRVRLFADGSETPMADVVVGSAPNYRVLHVRRAGEDAVYEVRGLAAYDVRPDAASWARKELVDLGGEQVDGLVLENSHGRFELARGEEGWTVVSPALVEGPLDSAQIEALLQAVTTMRLVDPVGATDAEGQGLARPAASLTLRSSGGEVVVRVGDRVPDKTTQRFVTRAGSGYTGTIWESAVQSLLDRKIDDLLAG